MRASRWTLASRLIEWTLLVVGVACLARYGWLSWQIARVESDNREAVSRMLAARPMAAPGFEAPAAESLAIPDPMLIGELDIPRLRVSAAVRVGDDSGVLAGAAGYLPDTAPPWEDGNTTVAAHRDRLFRPLAGIRIGDEILFSTRHGDFEYRVSRTFIVDPDDVWVLNPAPGVDLTLITCYPFVYVGHAPRRFVVRATKVRF